MSFLENREYPPEELEAVTRAKLGEDPDNTEALFYLAASLALQDRRDEAIEPLERFCALKPDSAEGWANLGFCYADIGLTDESSDHIRHALDLDPELHDAREQLAGNLYMQGKGFEALAVLEEGLAFESGADHEGYWTLKGKCLIQEGCTGLNAVFFQDAVERFPENINMWLSLAECLNEADDVEGMINAFERAIKLSPDNYSIYINYARGLCDRDCFEQAMPVVGRAAVLYAQFLRDNPMVIETSDVAYTKAYVLMHLRRFDEAEAEAKRAKAINQAYAERARVAGYEHVMRPSDEAAETLSQTDHLVAMIERARNSDGERGWQDDYDGGTFAMA